MISFLSDKLKTPKILSIIGLVGVYLLASGTSYLAFKALAGRSPEPSLTSPEIAGPGGKSKIDLSTPKTEACPLNGEKYTTAEKKLWESRRPIVAMIENHEDARPQSGLSRSDVIYEAVAEGGITRFSALFYCAAQAQDVVLAPVRSSRIYFVKLAQEYGGRPIYAHIGGANAGAGETPVSVRALEYLENIGWRTANSNDFDTTFDSGYPTFWRDYERLGREVLTEHTMSSSTERIWAQAAKRKLTNVDEDGLPWNKTFIQWKFKDEAADSGKGSVAKISFGFWGGYGAYNVEWDYNQVANNYVRSNGGKQQVDHENNEPLAAKNIVVQFVQEKGPLDVHKHMWYGIEGTGKALVFQDGQVVQAVWTKATSAGRTIYTDSKSGKEISFVRGRIWIEIVPIGNKINY